MRAMLVLSTPETGGRLMPATPLVNTLESGRRAMLPLNRPEHRAVG
ncbi:MAG TPA: hypothetical protein VGN81_19170 [Pseudonocardiaceae bacterium]|jgi:hypothetical protein